VRRALSRQAGNQRFAGTNDFGWRLLVDNPLEDVGPEATREAHLDGYSSLARGDLLTNAR
jgi:hypothetical protein